MALSPSRANVLMGGIADWKIKLVADGLYRTLSSLRTGKIDIKPLETKDSQGRAIQYGYDLTGSGQFLAVGTAAHFADLLSTIGTSACSHKIQLINGQYVNSGGTSMDPATFGVKWKLVSDKDMDDSMYCELTATRRLTAAEYLLVLASSTSNPADGSNSTDILATLLPVRADIVPAGIVKIELGASAGLGDVVTSLRNGKFTAELLTTKDSRGQDIGYAVKIDFSCEGLETANAELVSWEAIAARTNFSKLTFAGGSTFTTATAALGITTGVSVDKDSDEVAVLNITGSGIILPSAFTTAWA